MPRLADRRPLNFLQHDVVRAAKAVVTAGQQVDRVSIDPATGKIDVIVKATEPETGGERAA